MSYKIQIIEKDKEKRYLDEYEKWEKSLKDYYRNVEIKD